MVANLQKGLKAVSASTTLPTSLTSFSCRHCDAEFSCVKNHVFSFDFCNSSPSQNVNFS